ncbi:hypothetical protein BT69DRAFT_1005996 [Atractiella rhizophila]|nr:hypothetical protein BT69DRAFT_1005996 [Atractiella rhizophila]
MRMQYLRLCLLELRFLSVASLSGGSIGLLESDISLESIVGDAVQVGVQVAPEEIANVDVALGIRIHRDWFIIYLVLWGTMLLLSGDNGGCYYLAGGGRAKTSKCGRCENVRFGGNEQLKPHHRLSAL